MDDSGAPDRSIDPHPALGSNAMRHLDHRSTPRPAQVVFFGRTFGWLENNKRWWKQHTFDGSFDIRRENQLRLVDWPVIYRDLYISGGDRISSINSSRKTQKKHEKNTLAQVRGNFVEICWDVQLLQRMPVTTKGILTNRHVPQTRTNKGVNHDKWWHTPWESWETPGKEQEKTW